MSIYISRESMIRQYSLINTTDTDGLAYRNRGSSWSRIREAFAASCTRSRKWGRKDRIAAHIRPPASYALIGSLAGGIGITPLAGHGLSTCGRGIIPFLWTISHGRTCGGVAEEIRGSGFAPRTRLHLAWTGEAVQRALRRGWTRFRRTHMSTPAGRARSCKPVRERVATKPGVVLHLEYFGRRNLRPRTYRQLVSGKAREIGDANTGRRQSDHFVEALRAAGIEVETSCEQGVCGTCLTTVLAGRPYHLDIILTEEEQKAGDRMLLCVSRSLDAELVLDR